jgi:class 3 adenylate cyclase
LKREDEDRLMQDDDEDHIRYVEFPLVGLSTGARMNWNVGTKEISFSGEVHNYCVCFIDIIGSTKISSTLTPTQLSRYYELFLNAIALIARNFRAKIVKNAGDALIFYFNDTSDPNNVLKFKNVLNCGLTMGIASNTLNAKMLSEKLPPIQYRISADYGEVSVARSASSQSEDLFGSAMNICAKINSKAKPNGLVIGENLYDIVKGLDEYVFVPSRVNVPAPALVSATVPAPFSITPENVVLAPLPPVVRVEVIAAVLLVTKPPVRPPPCNDPILSSVPARSTVTPAAFPSTPAPPSGTLSWFWSRAWS